MTRIAAPRALPAAAKRALRIMFIARHVHWDGGLHPTDGTHATYHREMRAVLEGMGLDLHLADGYEALFAAPDVDFVFPLLNRGGFLNSEMLLPLLCERRGIPYLGASPILRGLSDDKHLAKRVAVARGLPTAPWALFRRGAPIDLSLCPPAARHVVKPNASSASWGISAAHDLEDVRAAVTRLHKEGHDVIVEPFIPGHDIEVSVITLDGEPFVLPVQIVEQDDPGYLRTYLEKRNLIDDQAYAIRPLDDDRVRIEATRQSIEIMREFLPFDYGRFEFRLNAATGALSFMEVNLNCNLWSRKTIAMAAAQIGWSHAELIETILTESLDRHGLLGGQVPDRVAA
ncbi:phosphoribosylglycinamide synthetase [Sphingomonas histidinilytica]|uniref:D-alanine-D-alanine ligase n=1 Tax=Rhizorhabdus histidinilytica TaxID=439228 RepID=A0A1T5FGV8_9SPHN|nr:phosphoribosylglycinamide synthetase [Rhizorhabdus histidinilytica]MBO9375634.1 phosphoribosylglycinamide synthetase [Rhizorhabdus histidinilytica]SKB95434.1 D-alanine-D-alanine ligase [Rhizorhabdus histidinilytica]